MDYNIGWHVLNVKPFREKRVLDSLTSLSLEAFLPLEEITLQLRGRKKTVFKPLFPSYIFVNIRSSLEFKKILSVKGACGYIRFGKEYGKITQKEIDQIKLKTESRTIKDIETDIQLPRIGEIKKIAFGPLTGLECEILKVKNEDNIIVRIDSLRQNNIVTTIPYYYISEIENISLYAS